MSGKSDYAGMTVNERLYSADLIEQFDSAARSRHQDSMVEILTQVDISETDAVSIVKMIFRQPEKYAY